MDSDAFGEHVQGIVNSGLTSLVFSLGNQLGLIDCLCHHFKDAATIEEIANVSKLKNRYVQEWLGCMAAAHLVQVTTADGICRYAIPEPHRRHILLSAEEASAVQMLARRQERARECFSLSGPNGFSYSSMPEMYEYMSNTERGVVAESCSKDILPHVGDLRHKLEQGCHVVDIGCGSGELLTTLARQFPESSFKGIDNCPDAVKKAEALIAKKEVTNVIVEEANAHSLSKSWNKCFDWVLMYDVLHDLPNPQTALSEIHRVLKDDAVFSLLEVGISSHHENNVGDMVAAGAYAFSIYACLPCSLQSGDYEKSNPGLGRENMEKLVSAAGFEVVKLEKFATDQTHIHMVCKKRNQISTE